MSEVEFEVVSLVTGIILVCDIAGFGLEIIGSGGYIGYIWVIGSVWFLFGLENMGLLRVR